MNRSLERRRSASCLPIYVTSMHRITHYEMVPRIVRCLVSRTLNRRSEERVSLETGYRCDAAKKLIPVYGIESVI